MPGLIAPNRGGLLRRIGSGDEGAVAVIVAIMMVVVLGMAALVVDVGGIESRKGMLQNAADAAALALAQECQDDGFGSCPAAQSNSSADLASATALAVANVSDRRATVDSIVYTPSGTGLGGSVKVSVSGVQDDLFAVIWGTKQTSIRVTATASWSTDATAMPLAFQACEFPSSSPQDVSLRSDTLALVQNLFGNCGLINGLGNALVPGWLTTDCSNYRIDPVTFITGTLSQVLPPHCSKAELDALVGHDVLLPVYNDPLVEQVVQCTVLGIVIPQHCSVDSWAVVHLTGYDFQSINASVSLGDILANVHTGELVNNPPSQCVTANTRILGSLSANLGAPLCQGIQGQFLGFVTPALAVSMTSATTGGVKLIA